VVVVGGADVVVTTGGAVVGEVVGAVGDPVVTVVAFGSADLGESVLAQPEIKTATRTAPITGAATFCWPLNVLLAHSRLLNVRLVNFQPARVEASSTVGLFLSNFSRAFSCSGAR
jgi:hypothetical protein